MQLPHAESPSYVRALDTALLESVRRHPLAVTLVLMAVDAVMLALSFWFAFLIRYNLEIGGRIYFWDDRPFSEFTERAMLFVAFGLLVLVLRGAYRLPRWTTLLDETLLIVGAVTVAMGGVVLANYLSQFSPSRLVFIYAWLCSIALLVAARFVRRGVLSWMWQRSIGVERVLIAGSGEVGRRLAQAVMMSPQSGLRIAGFADSDALEKQLPIGTERGVKFAPRLGDTSDISRLVVRHGIDEVLIALPPERHKELLQIANACRTAGVRFKIVPDLLQLAMERTELTDLAGMPLLEVRSASIIGIDASVKRALDLFIALPLLVLAGFPMTAYAAYLKLKTGNRVLKSRQVAGRNGVPLLLNGFARVAENHTCESTVSRIFLSTPLLLQVVSGDLSLVGPLAQSTREVDDYLPWQRARLMATPGLTGFWRLGDRRNMTFDEMVRLDLFYAEHWSPLMDIKILLRTMALPFNRGARVEARDTRW